MGEMIGKQSVKFAEAPYIFEGASVVGPKEGEGPLGKLFDKRVAVSVLLPNNH